MAPSLARALDARCLLLAMLLAGQAGADALPGEVLVPPESRLPVELERELEAPWQAGGEIVVFAADGALRAGRLVAPPRDAGEERARRAEQFALARKLNLVTAPRVVPMAPPLVESQVELLERFAMSDAGAVWFREVADDTLRLFNQGYLEVDPAPWRGFLADATRPRLSELITGRLSEAGMFAQDAAVFRVFAFDGFGAMAAAASIRMGQRGFRCNFPVSGELVDPFAILSHEFGHTRHGDPRSAGLPLGEARTVARYENPVRLRNGFPPRAIYYLRVEPGRPAVSKDPLFARVLAWRQEPGLRVADLDPVQGLFCECPGAPEALHNCLALPAGDFDNPDAASCGLRWVAVRVNDPETSARERP